mmetsp:Transcript_14807/g.31633  ORF Transcript_14807/g.31633 Transcript_14807/m.31633 type:complete len:467 (-) Transcript_14807:407-1807(-)|eukprot:CAMPEP_0168173084 /NCGR_PEP_ID=MMETSP0139_2-20121125/5663_1 /TAXON_ID=44445 /ORGANISM="Pseudo-nitzschia australis, Strain 10249 10 AB" /LENGTH=466 /DNA_ID=CAMNT_0008090907 /DNA_START=69 /DNA_END=1469 /DNA_ORIENTATION=-
MMKPTNFVLFALLSAATTFSAVVVADPEANTDAIEAVKAKAKQRGSRYGTSERSGIVGGVQSRPRDFPYFVDMDFCGGALIAPDIVLFAAHCGTRKGRQIAIGAYETNRLVEGAQERFCEEYIPDPKWGYLDYGLVFDFALCKLNEPVVLSSTVATLVLNEDPSFPSDDPNVITDLIVMGFGLQYDSFGSNTPMEIPENPYLLHNVTVPYMSNEVCRSFPYYEYSIGDSSLCAGFVSGEEDACYGDSGGPIVERTYVGGTGDSKTAYVDTHVGVVSWGIGCARENSPGVYARTSTRVGWIKATACNSLDSVADFCKDVPKPLKPKPAKPAPTAGYSYSYSCDTGQDLTIRLTTDKEAYFTSWVLETANTHETIMARKYKILEYTNEHKICLHKEACYTWEVADEFGDGFLGSYSIILNGKEVAAGTGDFYDRKRESFCTTSVPPNVTPTRSPKKTKSPKVTKSPKK